MGANAGATRTDSLPGSRTEMNARQRFGPRSRTYLNGRG